MTNGDGALSVTDVNEPGSSAAAQTAAGPGRGVSRRAMVAGAAWAVPAIAVMTATPAFAVSSALLTLSSPKMQVPASGAVTVTATLKRATGSAWAGQAVSFSGPSGATFSPSSGVTNTSGIRTTSLNLGTPWAKPGSTVTVNAISGSETKSQPFTVLGANMLAAGGSAYYDSTLAQNALAFPSPIAQAGGGLDPSGSSAADGEWYVVLLQDGTVWTLGGNLNGQLGDGSKTTRSTWAQVPGLAGVTQIATGQETAYAMLSDGTVKAWGSNFGAAAGQPGGNDQTSPVAITGLSGVTQIAAGNYQGYALLSDGTVKAWGVSSSLGDGSTVNRATPGPVSDLAGTGVLSGVTQIAAHGAGGYALLSDKTVVSWGANTKGQIGDGSTTNRLKPVQVSGLSNVTHISGGTQSGYALLSDKTVRAWGSGGAGQLGNGGTADSATPVAVSNLTSVAKVVSGASTAYALSTDGSVRSWGGGANGQLGNGSSSNMSTPVAVTALQGQSAVGFGGGVWSRACMIITAV